MKQTFEINRKHITFLNRNKPNNNNNNEFTSINLWSTNLSTYTLTAFYCVPMFLYCYFIRISFRCVFIFFISVFLVLTLLFYIFIGRMVKRKKKTYYMRHGVGRWTHTRVSSRCLGLRLWPGCGSLKQNAWTIQHTNNNNKREREMHVIKKKNVQ